MFGVDVLGFSVMSIHLHAILRSRPDVVKACSDEEVARRWWNLFPQRRNKDCSPAEPADTGLNHLMADAKMLAQLRARLSSISWFMLCMSEVIARMANAEEAKPAEEDKKGAGLILWSSPWPVWWIQQATAVNATFAQAKATLRWMPGKLDVGSLC